jgi:hypothetical protein
MKLEDFIGSLKAHEAILQEDKPQKKKMVALESQTKEHSENEQTEGDNASHEDDEEELAFLSRRIQKLMLRRNQLKKSFPARRSDPKPETDMSQIRCYGCNQLGHFKTECPKLKQSKPSFKRKSMMATWDDLEELSEMEEEEANVCLMTKSDNEEVTLEPCSSCIRTEHFCDNLLYDCQITTQKNNELREEVIKITHERDLYKNEVDTLKEALKNMQVSLKSSSKQITDFSIQEENAKLKKDVSVLEKDLSRFLTSTKTFEKINGSCLDIISASGLGFGPHQKEEICKKSFIPHKEKYVQKLFCSFCHRHGHVKFFCFKRKALNKKKYDSQNILQNRFQKNVPYRKPNVMRNQNRFQKNVLYKKPTVMRNTNSQGPKSVWVPKVLLNSHAGMSPNKEEQAMVLGQWLLKAYDWRQT